MFTMANKFSTWINSTLRERGWTQADLHRASGLSRATISKLASPERFTPNPETVTAIAKAFKLPPVFVYKQAGLIPQEKDKSPTLEEANQLLDELPEEYQKQALALIRFLHKTHIPNNPRKAKSSPN